MLGIELFGDIVRKYRLDYDEKGIVPCSRLIRVQEAGANGETLPAVEFDYDDSEEPVSYSLKEYMPWPGFDTGAGVWFSGDINGDGMSDLVNFHFWFFWNHYVSTHISNGEGSFLPASQGFVPWPGYVIGTGSWYSGDYNGDGKTDFFHTVPALFGGQYAHTWISNGDGTYTVLRSAPGDCFPIDAGRWLSADINGDGRTDMLHMFWIKDRGTFFQSWISKGNGEFEIKNSSLNPGLPLVVNTFLFGADATMEHVVPVRVGDFNGDGKDDLAIIGFGDLLNSQSAMVFTALSQGDGSFNLLTSTLPNNPVIDRIAANSLGRPGAQYLVGDFNGDGKADLLLGTEDNRLVLLSSKGDGSFEISLPLSDGYGSHTGTWDTTDVNGDGKCDIVHYISGFNIPPQEIISLSEGDGNFIQQAFLLPAGYPIADGYRFQGSIAANPTNDIVHVITQLFNNKIIAMTNTWQHSNLITKIKEPSGRSVDIEYTPLLKVEGALHPDESSYPYIANKSRRYLATRLTADDGRGSTYPAVYDYENAKFYTGLKPERKDLLFETVTITNEKTNEKTETHFIQNDYRLHGRPSVAKEYVDCILIKCVEYHYNSKMETIFGTTLAQLESVRQTNYERGTPVSWGFKQYEYDDYGNTIKIIDSAQNAETVTTDRIYAIDTGEWSLRRLSEETIFSDGEKIKQRRFQYTGNNLTADETLNIEESRWVRRSFGYDDNGNIISATDPLGHISTTQYDADYHTFPVQIVNAKGHVTTADYDFRFGSKLAETDCNGNTVHYEYDQFGRLVKTIQPGGDWTTAVVYHITGNANTQYIETRVADDSALGYHYRRQYMDAMGRVYRTVQKAQQSGDVTLEQEVDVTFNEKGLRTRESLPYLTGTYNETPLYITYEYDAVNRLTRTAYPDGTYETISYFATGEDGTYSEKMRDRNGYTHELVRDARGRVIKKHEPNNVTVTYAYDNAGLVSSVTNTDGLVTSIKYDSMGRKIAIQDPDTGRTTYTYNDAGLMTSSHDANGNTVAYEYDEINRITKIDHPAGTPDVVYSYDDPATANGIGRVARVYDGVSDVSYAYDVRGHVAVKIQEIDGRKFIFRMEYDRPGRVTQIVYPDGTAVAREYSDMGSLKAVRWDGSAIVKYGRFKENGGGGIGEINNYVYRVTGDGIESKIEYNPANLRPIGIVSRKDRGEGEIVEDVSYEFDSAGNVTSLTDNRDGAVSQSFRYDALSRLVSANGIYGHIDYVYTNNGNLLQKGDLGLHYDPRHPYAVSYDTDGNHYAYDANGNMTTRKEDTLRYDAVNRLISIERDGSIKASYTYDHTNNRVKKLLKDATVVYNIEGLYEIAAYPDGNELHTKYFYGIKNELAAQMTVENATLITSREPAVINRFYAKNDPLGLVLYCYQYVEYAINNRSTLRYFTLSLLFLFLFLLTLFIIKYRKSLHYHERIPVWARGFAAVLCICVFTVLGISGCSSFLDTYAGGPFPWPLITPGAAPRTPGSPIPGMFFFHPDYNRNISYVTDAQGGVVFRLNYKPYGEIAHAAGIDAFRYKFNSHESDVESGLSYYHARYYDPHIGRFITPDTIVPRPEHSQSFNRYMYVLGNPVSSNDPSGNSADSQMFLYSEMVMSAWDQQQQNKKPGVFEQMLRSLINSATGCISLIEGGGYGFLAHWVTNFLNIPEFNLSYSYAEGWGVTAGATYKGCGGGSHWQEKGPNKGFSQWGTASISYKNFSIGLTTSYNFNKNTIANHLRVSLSGRYGAIGLGYSWVNNFRSGKLLYRGASGYAGVNISGMIGALPTSSRGDGRYMYVKQAQFDGGSPIGITKAVTGIDTTEPNNPLAEYQWYFRLADALLTHGIAVTHDNACVVLSNLSATDFGGMLLYGMPGLYIGYSGLFQRYDYNNWYRGF